jgi:hypothetical protein
MTFSLGSSHRVLVYAMISTLIAAFGTMGAFIGAFIGPEFPLVGLLLGSVLGVFLAVHENTILGCLVGMVIGLAGGLCAYYLIDFETAYMVVFLFSLLGAFLGEPLAYFWHEAGKPGRDEESRAE